MRLGIALFALCLAGAWTVRVWADDVPSLRASSHHHTTPGGGARTNDKGSNSNNNSNLNSGGPTTRNTQRDRRTSNNSSDEKNSKHHNHHSHNGNHHHRHGHHHRQHLDSSEYEFGKWVRSVLGITTSLRIEHFEYYDYMRALKDQTDVFSDDDDDDLLFGLPLPEGAVHDDFLDDVVVSVADYPRVRERGLAAAHDIQVGETIIQIPHQALWTIENVIDQDPILSKVMGAEKRQVYGWDGQGNASMRRYYELPLLAIAILHHSKLGQQSPHWPYLQLLQSTPVDKIPFTWNQTQLKREASPGVRRVARGIQRDIHELYAAMVQILIDEHPALFGRPSSVEHFSDDEDDVPSILDDDDVNSSDEDDAENEYQLDQEEEWMFSFQKFRWAFAIVNSRHWHLPIPSRMKDNTYDDSGTSNGEKSNKEPRPNEEVFYEEEDVVDYNVDEPPPASMPTDEWVRHQQHKEEESKASKEDRSENRKLGEDFGVVQSFMLPFAELLNFGPPCTRGFFNKTSQSFDIVATCPFKRGQEVTFYYSDACSDVIVGNYGFNHPMVPKCPTIGDWRRRSEIQEQQIDDLQFELISVYEELRILDEDLGSAAKMLADCDCQTEGAQNVEIEEGDLPSAPMPASPRKPTISSPQVKMSGPVANFDLEAHEGIRGGSIDVKRGNTRIQQLKQSRHRRRSSVKSQPDL